VRDKRGGGVLRLYVRIVRARGEEGKGFIVFWMRVGE
jgi:hypothetical protein